jgi:hypothetical protein
LCLKKKKKDQKIKKKVKNGLKTAIKATVFAPKSKVQHVAKYKYGQF